MACYIVTGLYGYDLIFDISLKTIVDWVEDNQDNLSQWIVNSHLETALAHNVSALLGWYLNACAHALCNAGL